jgi:hypothetical protein
MDRKIEDFIRQHRPEFDDKEPSGRVWAEVRNSLPLGNGWIRSLAVWRAAAIFFMAASAFLLWQRVGESKGEQATLREFQDVEMFYNDQIAVKIELIEANSNAEGALNGFTKDFHQLEAMYQVLKEEMKARPSKQVKDALVLNLLIRIDLLNQQLHKLEKSTLTKEEGKNAI